MIINMKSKNLFALIFILHVIFVVYLAFISGFCAKSSGSSPVLPTSVALKKSVTQDTPNQIFGKDYFDSEEKVLNWDFFYKNKSEEQSKANSVHIQCEADNNLNFFTVDDENGKRFDKLISQMAADVINNNFSVVSDNWRNSSLVMEMSLLLPLTLEKYAICVSHCSRLDEECKVGDLDYTIEDISNRMSKVMSLTLNVSHNMVECSGFSDYFREQDAQIEILTWEDQIVRSQNVKQYLKKGSVLIYGLFELDDILKAKGVRCTLQFQQYRNIQMNWYLFVCLAAIPSAFLCVAFCCFLQRILQIFGMNDNNSDHWKNPSEYGEEGKIRGDGYKGSQEEANIGLELLEIQKSKDRSLDAETRVHFIQRPPFPGAVKGKKVHMKIYKVEANKKQSTLLQTARPSIEHKGEMADSKIENVDILLGEALGYSASVGANRTE